jgi:hypothetical protein
MTDGSKVTPSCYEKIRSPDGHHYLRDDIDFYVLENERQWDVQTYKNALTLEAELGKTRNGKRIIII